MTNSSKDTARLTQTDTARQLIGWLWRKFLSKHVALLALSVVFMAVEGSMMGALSWMMQPMFDLVFIEGKTSALWWVGLAILGIFIARAIASMGQKILLTQIAQKVAARLRTQLLDRLMLLDNAFHQEHPPGYLIQRVQNDVNQINTVWSTVITGAGRDVIALIVLMSVAVSVDWKWTLVAFIGIPFLVLPSLIVQKFVRRRAREARDLGARLATRLDEVFHGIIAVKLNRLEDYQSRQYRELTDDLVKTEVRSAAGVAAIPGLIDMMAGVGFLGVLVFGGSEIIAGDKTVGQFMTFFTALGFAFEPLRRLGAVSGQWQVAAASIERLKELLETEPKLHSPAQPKALPVGHSDIIFDDVHLSYGETKVLNGASFTAKAGETTAIVGASGAGKSTLFNVLTRLVDPQSGRVLIGDTNIADLKLEELRDQFSVVSQDAMLFDESLRENILLGRPRITEKQLMGVLDAAYVSDFVKKMPDGLDTRVGPRGSGLSGGQRQRVVIARALLRNTPFLLLDEATSALDAQSEVMVQQALDKLSERHTTLVIAHRLSTVRDADKIIVMDKGRVIEEGGHEELLAQNGTYADLYNLQFTTSGPTAEEVAKRRNVPKVKQTRPRKSIWAKMMGRLPRI
ncbi:ABC transporter ATP-binding protein [Cognatishimia sp. SS12]|uniref:ABC transporter ATP-binding protein n=1 Tax=Cognatishimia sp. SS12 TaxID=2979465 RepID=UPI00233090AE|nr:ABC transporter ATP-binding protein [Cognatishimia sp. SS12]MDC0739669.1 ABC transporter ATP-binding protein [Cognatishimia sp. SS12]